MNLTNFIHILSFIYLCLHVSGAKENDNSTVLAVHVIFRHGDRTPSSKVVYATDPYMNDSYAPYGQGQLTNAGKNRQYNLGIRLRERYKAVIGKAFHPDVLFAMSTKVKRTITSLQCVLAGMFPPEGEFIWNKELNWQPVAMETQNNELLSAHTCIDVKPHIMDYRKNDTKYWEFLNTYKWLFTYLNQKAGGPYTDAYDVYKLYCTLYQQDTLGYKLPEWTKSVYPDPMARVAVHNYYHYCGNTQLRQMIEGSILRKIILDSKHVICGKSTNRIFLYSGHQVNVACFLYTLGLFREHMPYFGAHVTVELVQFNNTYGFRILYQNRETDPLAVMKLPNCEEFCPFTQFVQIVKKYFPKQIVCVDKHS